MKGNDMGKLTEMWSAVTTPAADLNVELYTHIDLKAENKAIIRARKLHKKAKPKQKTLF